MDTKATDQARHIFNFLEATRITELTGFGLESFLFF